MATSFKIKAVEELRKAKQIEREAEAMAHAQSDAAKHAKNVANEKRIADKMARNVYPVSSVEEKAVEEEAVVVEQKPKVKAKVKAKANQTI